MASHPWYIDFRLNNGNIIEVHEGEAKNLASLGMGCKLKDWSGNKKAVKEPEAKAVKKAPENKSVEKVAENKTAMKISQLKNKAKKKK
jgi:hypothetical protein